MTSPTTGKYYRTSPLRNWFRNFVSRVIALFPSYPNLNYYLNNRFQSYRRVSYNNATNAVFRSCFPPFGDTNPSTVSLQDLESAINLFGIRHLSRAAQNQFKSRMSSNDYDVSFGVCLELLLAGRFQALVGPSTVTMYPPLASGRFSDLLVNVGNKNVYVEAGNLSQSTPEKKIQKILNNSARYLWRKLRSPCFLEIEIDSAQLALSRQGYISVARSVAKIKHEIDRMHLGELAGFEGLIMIDEAIMVCRNFTVYQNLRAQGLFPTNPSDFLTMTSQPSVALWIQVANPASFGQSDLILSLIGQSTPQMTLVRAQGFLPSKAAFLESQSFISHIIRQIRAQLHQLQAGHPNIILVQDDNWMIFGVGDGLLDFQPVKDECIDFFNQSHISDLSGICVMGPSFNRMFYVSNPHSTNTAILTQSEVQRLGMQWIP